MNEDKNNRVVGKVTVTFIVPKSLKLELDHLVCDRGITRATLIRKNLAKEIKAGTVGDSQNYSPSPKAI